MSKKSTTTKKSTSPMKAAKKSAKKARSASPHAIAQSIVAEYFAAIAADIPGDAMPGDVMLLNAALDIQQAVFADMQRRFPSSADPEDAALKAGYLLGIEVGKRLAGGAR